MVWLSLRLVHLALLASATSLVGYAGPALAQIPMQPAARSAEPEPSAVDAVTLPPAAAELPPPPAPPTGASTSPPSPSAPAPAKADRITAPGAHHEADPSVDDDREDEAEEARAAQAPEWYGWQTLIADAPSLTAFAAGLSMMDSSSLDGSRLMWAGIAGYELAPAIIHFVHHNPGRGFASFGMRFGLPLAGAFIGASLASGCNTDLCEAGGAGIGAVLGMGGAVAIDAAVLAYDDRKRSVAPGAGLMPLASVSPHQAWIGVGGAL